MCMATMAAPSTTERTADLGEQMARERLVHNALDGQLHFHARTLLKVQEPEPGLASTLLA